MRIVIAGETDSANVGDQAIYTCLAYLLRKANPSIEVIPLDISGRTNRAAQSRRITPTQRIALLQNNPALQMIFPAFNLAYDLIKRRSRTAIWKPDLRRANLLVIGGGQLLMDDCLNFPLKLTNLAHIARTLGIPHTITACGVGKSWSATAGSMFRPLLAEAKSITLREHLSQERLNRLFSGLPNQVTFDPAIWAGEVYPMLRPAQKPEMIGLGVINRNEANVHFAQSGRFSEREWLGLWIDLIGELQKANLAIELFTTGSPVDQEFAMKLFSALQERNWKRVNLAPRPTSPQALISSLEKYALVVAARLHAAVLANALGIATIGLGWDSKVQAYYQLTGRADLCFELANLETKMLVQACIAMYGQSFPEKEIEQYKARSFEDAEIILKEI